MLVLSDLLPWLVQRHGHWGFRPRDVNPEKELSSLALQHVRTQKALAMSQENGFIRMQPGCPDVEVQASKLREINSVGFVVVVLFLYKLSSLWHFILAAQMD